MNAYLPNQRRPETRLFCGGQPDEAQLVDFAAAHPGGCVINLRPAAETDGWDEAAVTKRLGLAYVNIPVAGPQDLTRTNAEAFAAAVEAHGDAPTLIHCASGQRAAALLALKVGWIDGCRTEEALAVGRPDRAGAAGARPAVGTLSVAGPVLDASARMRISAAAPDRYVSVIEPEEVSP